jgi:uncharacterized phosphatase
MYIYLIRHGQTEWNKQSRIQGREDIPLSEEGILQAQECAAALMRCSIGAVYASPLMRAVSTAQALGSAFGVPVKIDERLIERDFGSASGMVVDIYHPEKYADDLEPLSDVADRMLLALSELEENAGGNIAAVSHGGSINAVLHRLSGGEFGSGKTRLKNACINVLSLDDGKLQVLDYNLAPSEFAEKYR